MTADEIKSQVSTAFGAVERPGNWALRGSNEGSEPYQVEEEFQDKLDWHTVDASFLDRAPAGLASALSFLSDEAFRYFLPAYLSADLDGKLERVDPAFYLCHGLGNASKTELVNPRRFGARTWWQAATYRFAAFTAEEARAIVSYLCYKAEHDEYEASRDLIKEALENYWQARAA